MPLTVATGNPCAGPSSRRSPVPATGRQGAGSCRSRRRCPPSRPPGHCPPSGGRREPSPSAQFHAGGRWPRGGSLPPGCRASCLRQEKRTRADREDQFGLLGAELDPVGQHGVVHLPLGALTGVRSGCFTQAPKSKPPAGATPAAFLRGKSLQPFLGAGTLNSRSRRRGPGGVHLGKIGLTRSTKLCPES